MNRINSKNVTFLQMSHFLLPSFRIKLPLSRKLFTFLNFWDNITTSDFIKIIYFNRKNIGFAYLQSKNDVFYFYRDILELLD